MREREISLDDLIDPGGKRFRERVYDYVRRVPPGRVVTYGEVAAELGTPRAARVVGGALRALKGTRPEGTDVPWHRVVNARGGISIKRPEAALLQEQLLRDEGVEFDPEGRIDLRRFGWSP